jgi:hypothetical protein
MMASLDQIDGGLVGTHSDCLRVFAKTAPTKIARESMTGMLRRSDHWSSPDIADDKPVEIKTGFWGDSPRTLL